MISIQCFLLYRHLIQHICWAQESSLLMAFKLLGVARRACNTIPSYVHKIASTKAFLVCQGRLRGLMLDA
jgi:hypothetical protein